MKKQMQILLGLAVALLAAGCASNKSELPPQAVSGLTELRSQLVDNQAQFEKTCAAAKDMINNPRQDADSQIMAFRSALDKLSADTQETRATGSEAQKTATDYFADWQKKLNELSGQMAEAGKQRRQESMDSWAKLQQLAAALREQFTPYMADMKSADKYLQTDATASGVQAAVPTVRSALARERDVKEKVNDVIKQIDVVLGGR